MTLTIYFEPGLKPILKHEGGGHDQKTHGNWARGITEELTNWNPEDAVPKSPKNRGSVPTKAWDNWEHGPDGRQFVDLYRQYAGEALGLDVPKSELDVGGSENYLTQRGFGASSTDVARKHALAMLDAIEKGDPQPALYRGITPVNNEDGRALSQEFRGLKEGDTIDLPLTSTSRSPGVATWYAANRVGGDKNDGPPILIKIQEGAKGISRSADSSYYPSDYEVITSGKFEVLGSAVVAIPYWEREMVGMRPGSNPERGDYITGWGSRRVDEYRDSTGEIKREAYDGLFQGVKNGDWSKVSTKTTRYTNDRGGQMLSPNFKYGDEIRLNRWDLVDANKEFLVIELRMVEPHRVQKASDLGAKFHILFGGRLGNDIFEEPFEKHGTHDQKTHGNWASGVGYKATDKHPKYDFNSEDGPNIEYYTNEGYEEINKFLRTGKSDPMGDEPDTLREYIHSLDKALDETSAPRDMVVYRGTSGVSKFDSLKEGDVFTDKAFVSTTTDLDTVWQFMSTATGDSQFDSRPFEKGYVLEISVPQGNRIFSVNNYFSETSAKYGPAEDIRSENEHILPRGSKFKVDSIGTIDVRGAKDKLIRVSVVKDDK